MNKLQFDNLLKPLIEIYDEIELDIIRNILERLESYNSVQGSLEWYLDKLVDINTLNKNNLKVFKNNKEKIKKELKYIANSCGMNINNLELLNKYYDEGLLGVNPIDIYKSLSINNLINNAIKDSDDIMELINTKALEGAKESYKNILNKAYIETASGIYSYDESIRRALKNFAIDGIRTVHYASGKTLSIEAVVRRDVITRMNKLVGDVEIEHAKELNTNLVYVDQHLGARTRTKYTKHDYEAHDEWQGKKYMIEGSNEKYDNLYEKTGYGEMLGLKGLNCYHNMRPTWEWEKIEPRIDEIENKKEYERLEKQRKFERNIRKLKRQHLIAKETNNKTELTKTNKKLTKYSEKYDNWLENNNFNRKYSREFVSDSKMLFEDGIIGKDFNNLDNSVEHLIIYDIDNNQHILKTSNNSKNSVGDLKTYKTLIFSKPNSLVPVHNHPSNSSFSFTDIATFNRFKSIGAIVVTTEKYFYYLEKNGINKIKYSILNKYSNQIRNYYFKEYGKTIESMHLVNKEIARKMGWNYGRIERK